MNPNDIEDTLEKYSNELSVSTAKLRAIYARGVNECLREGYDGAPYTYGLARVQRFIVAYSNKNPRLTKDTDFLPRNPIESSPVIYEITENTTASWGLVYDTMSADGKMLIEMFPSDSVSATLYNQDTDEITVLGDYDGVQWSCTLNLATGESVLDTSSR